MNNKSKIVFFFWAIVIIVMLLSSCVTQKRCREKFPPAVTEIYSSIKDSIVTVHDTIKIPGATAYIRDSIPCPDVEYHRTEKSGHATVKVDISKGVIKASANCDSLERENTYLKHYIKTVTTKETTKTDPPVIVKESYWYDIALRWVALIELIIIGIFYLLLKKK